MNEDRERARDKTLAWTCLLTPLAAMLLFALWANVLRSAQPSAVAWREDYAAARLEASAANKPLLIVFSGRDCTWCRKLEAGPLRDPAVVAALARYVCVHLDADDEANDEPVRRYCQRADGTRPRPTLTHVAPDGAQRRRLVGYHEAAPLAAWLRKN